MTRPSGVMKSDQAARIAWGEAYERIPKSVFAMIAWHLANAASASADTEGEAEKRFAAEWDILLAGKHIPQDRRKLRVLPEIPFDPDAMV